MRKDGHIIFNSCPQCTVKHERNACPSRDADCTKYGKRGYLATVCWYQGSNPSGNSGSSGKGQGYKKSWTNAVKFCFVKGQQGATLIDIHVSCQGHRLKVQALPGSGAEAH